MNNKLPLSGVRVLLVDDEEDALTITRLMLELHGAEVVTAPAAAEGLEKVQTYALDIIISDISMPQMDGYQFIRAVRNLPAHKGRNTPALALSAFNRSRDRASALDAGFLAYLSKPVLLQELITEIMTTINSAAP
ncbi:Response regulator receiver domain-containing protein [Nitrosospira multiformis]|uniref:Response regulator receiver domain-containing protein n=1 Tax=Nitrosospira multiformis TaxID=1231 RepID=A0A1I0BN65_9PROT|nr:response regulator [Nitrosospira multiformis]SET08064.1 Response regulator receiver domain-containing protein [Nitrosospira multiformis]